MRPEQLFEKYGEGEKSNNRKKSSDSDTDSVMPERTSPTELMFLSNKPIVNLSSKTNSLPSIHNPKNTSNLDSSELNIDTLFVKTFRRINGHNLKETFKNSNEDTTKERERERTILPQINDPENPNIKSSIIASVTKKNDPTLTAGEDKVKNKIKSKSKNRCAFTGCKVKVSSVLSTGQCPKCSSNFCGKHRLYELHNCPFYSEVKKEYKLNNEKTLLKNRTQQQMITKI